MGGADGRKADLFDSSSRSGPTDLLDMPNRKRKAAAMDSPQSRYDHYDPQMQQKHYYPPNLDLGAMLYPDRISKGNYRNIQAVLKDQDKKIQDLIKDAHARDRTIDERGQEISKRCDEISSLKHRVESLGRQNDRLRDEKQRMTASENSLKHLRERKEQAQTQVKEKEDLLAAGTKVINERNETVKRMEADNSILRQTVTDRDAMISKLNEQIWKVTTTTTDEQVKVRLEAQAQTSLNMLNGLKNELNTREEKIRDLENQVAEMDRLARAHVQAKTDSQREAEGMKRELAKQKEAAEAAAKKAKEATEVAADQESLIKRIMEENKRLAGVA